MVTGIRFVPCSDGKRLSDVVPGDLCFFSISHAGWLKVEPSKAENPRHMETRHYPPGTIESISTGCLRSARGRPAPGSPRQSSAFLKITPSFMIRSKLASASPTRSMSSSGLPSTRIRSA